MKKIVLFLGAVILLLSGPLALLAATGEDLDIKRRQLQELQVQLRLYQEQLRETERRGGQVQKQITTLEQDITATNRAISALESEIKKVSSSLKETTVKISNETARFQRGQRQLAETLRLLSSVSTTPFIVRLFQPGGLTQWLLDRKTLGELQIRLAENLKTVRASREKLEILQDDLEVKSRELATTQGLKEIAARQLAEQKKKKQSDLKTIKAEAQRFKSLADLSSQQVAALQQEISGLQKSGISLEQAIRLGLSAGNRTGVRPALLLGVLEVETRLGQFLGTGNWREDMHPRDHEAFFTITKKLGLNPDTQPVSKKPSYGWGGAMGPAQFLPKTWLGYEVNIAKLTGHEPPSPWDPEDAFTAAGLFLKARGAKIGDLESERRAVKSYISGDPNCSKSICNYYADLVMSKALHIEQQLLSS